MIPATIHPHVRSGGERRVFALFQNAPGTDSWLCLHSLGLAPHVRKRRAEIDFLLVTGKGVFVLEVKAGRVARKDGAWVFTDRYGQSAIKYESPFDQAASGMFALEQDLRRHFGQDSRVSRLLLGYGVMFPDVEFDCPGCEADRGLIYDVRDRDRPLTAYIDRLTQFTQGRQPVARFSPTKQDADSLITFLRGDFEVVPPFRIDAADAAQEMLRLTQEQYGVLDAVATCPRCVIQGPAGTGKTLLAVETAKREARDRRRTLVLCYNRLLASQIRSGLDPDVEGGSIDVFGVYSFCDCLIKNSSLAAEFESRRSSWTDEELYRVGYPDYAGLAALEAKPYDVLVLDEAQDYTTPGILGVLESMLEGGLEAGRWRVFLDANNQARVFGAFDPQALERLLRFGVSSVLTVNCRNTKPIAMEASMLTRPETFATARVDGRPVSYVWYTDKADQVVQLARVLKGLRRDGALPGAITVLSPRAGEGSCAAECAREGRHELTPVTDHNAADVVAGKSRTTTYASVSAFKGLENDVVILTDVEDLTSPWWRSVIYVGMSRARTGLFVLLPESMRPSYEERLRERLEMLDHPTLS